MDRQQPAQAQVLVGIDIGKHAHHAAAVAADGQLVWARRVANDQAAIAEMIGQATVASVRDARKDWSLGSDDRSEVRAMSRANN